MPLGGILKGLVGESQVPKEKSEQMMVAESLMMELDFQLQEADQLAQERAQEERRKSTGVDYSWLVTAPSKGYEIPQVERMEIEDLCLKVKPSECGKVITMFRDSLLREPSIQDIPRMLRAVINQVLDMRPKEDNATIPEWLTKSFTKLRPSPRVTPISSISGDLELQGASANSLSSASNSESHNDDFVSYTSVDQLPV